MKNFEKYERKYDWKKPKNRTWVDKEIEEAPIWCSVDLRDGNQALANPMTMEEKIEFFDYLVKIGFKDIEVGFPAASDTEFNFVRYLIENNKIPDDVRIQVLTQAREDIIEKTFRSLKGAKKAIVHLYNSTSKQQREIVFKKGEEEIKALAVKGAQIVKKYAQMQPETDWTFEYSPESFTGTEMDYAIDVVNGVTAVWDGVTNNKIIINLPSTVESSTPNIYADQIEYVCENLNNRENIIVSVHTHNDRGTAVAASELAILAGADRVEGTIFGNGERTGNADIVNIAMNMYTLGVDPKLDFSDMMEVRRMYEKYVKMPINPRIPYAGEKVFIAYSGSHQDAIAKGMDIVKESPSDAKWNVPYLPLDPQDIGREYEIIGINSQSGKGGIAYKINEKFGIKIPDEKKAELSYFIKGLSDRLGRELTDDEIFECAKKVIDKINSVKNKTANDFNEEPSMV